MPRIELIDLSCNRKTYDIAGIIGVKKCPTPKLVYDLSAGFKNKPANAMSPHPRIKDNPPAGII